VPAGDSPPASLARQRAVGAAEAVAAALTADPTLAERQQRRLDVLAELLRRLTPLARQVTVAIESERLAAAGASTVHLGRINRLAAEELDAVSARCTELAAQVATAAWPDWESPVRIRELSSSRMPDEHELAEIADMLRRAVAPALDLPYPDPEATRLVAPADQIVLRTAEAEV
jgi:septal ring factor EnvC (AmiA/AmiB activator)